MWTYVVFGCFLATTVSAIQIDVDKMPVHIPFLGLAIRLGSNFLRHRVNLPLSPGCKWQLQQFISGLENQEMWAIKMLDATSKLESGVFRGNTNNLGSFEECYGIHNQPTTGRNGTEDLFSAQYCLGTLHMGHISDQMATFHERFTQALCAPASCSVDDLNLIAEHFWIPIRFAASECYSQVHSSPMTYGQLAFITLIALVVILMAASTSYEIYATTLRRSNPPPPPISVAFSLLANGRKLFAAPCDADHLTCLAGVRTISLMWITLGHIYFAFQAVGARNLVDYLPFLTATRTLAIRNATLAVDTFLLMSGIVQVYSYLKMQQDEAQGRPHLIQFYLHRYIRLTPALFIVVMAHTTVLERFGPWPLWHHIQQEVIDDCKTYWWSALLYIQNLVNPGHLCVVSTWFLAVDMQLAIVSPVFLFLIKRRPKLALNLVFAGCCLSMACSFSIAWYYELVELTCSMNTNEAAVHKFLIYSYIQPHTRATPWLMGIILGYFLFQFKHNGIQFEIGKTLNLVLWGMALFVMNLCVFYNPVHLTSRRLAMSTYIAFFRPTWAVAVAWILFACVTNHGGVINRLLSCHPFQVLSRLSYAIYLTHFTVITLTLVRQTSLVEFSNGLMFFLFTPIYIVIILVSTFLTLAFELPIIAIEKHVLSVGGMRNYWTYLPIIASLSDRSYDSSKSMEKICVLNDRPNQQLRPRQAIFVDHNEFDANSKVFAATAKGK